MSGTKKIKKKLSLSLSLGALGVVYGDIGTSPIYALRLGLGDMPVNLMNIFGVLSLIFWTLFIVISIKYLTIIFRADNNGEGGILALLALLKQRNTRYERFLYLIAIFGVGLLLGDGMLTPAISVTSAVKGLGNLSTDFDAYLIPLSCLILFFIFMMQSNGTGKLSTIFGPLILVWFITIALLGLVQVINYPSVLRAINPYYAFHFLSEGGLHSYLLLGGIFLVVTGGEALYADMGQFGKSPIRYSWFLVVFPSLILNYFGQGAYLLTSQAGIEHPFYDIAPSWFTIPLILIAIVATIIASQAIISATFSLIKQAILLGFCPRIPIIQTSQEYQAQIYIPQINFILFLGTFFLLITFKSTENLAHAYGIAVNLYMLLITAMIAYTARIVWKWSVIKVTLIFGVFLTIDIAFLGANSHKFFTGGWLPVCFALVVAFVMYSWSFGLDYLREHFYLKKENISKILKQLNYKALNHLEGVTSIFITDVYDRSGGSFLHFLKLSLTVPEHTLMVSYVVENIPYVEDSERYEVSCLNNKVCQLTLHYGFMDFISIPYALAGANTRNILPFPLDVEKTNYIVEVPNIIASNAHRSLLFNFQEKLFAFLMRNYSANLNIEFYNLPYNKTIAIGAYCLI